MSAKGSKAVRGAKKAAQTKAVYLPYFSQYIYSGQATPAPPLGPQLGHRGINVAQFCKDFNERTAHMIEGVPLPCKVWVNPDRSYKLTIQSPTTTWLVSRAAGIRRGATNPHTEIAGKITVKHVYEIAKIKAKDEVWLGVPLEKICKLVIVCARAMGVHVYHKIDPVEYKKFLEERQIIVDQQLKAFQDLKAAKTLRTEGTDTASSSTKK